MEDDSQKRVSLIYRGIVFNGDVSLEGEIFVDDRGVA